MENLECDVDECHQIPTEYIFSESAVFDVTLYIRVNRRIDRLLTIFHHLRVSLQLREGHF